jgi:hypothetical protein
MAKTILKVFFLFILLVFLSSQGSLHLQGKAQNLDVQCQPLSKAHNELNTPQIDLDYGKIPLYFIPNQGQVPEEALFYAKAQRYTLWLTKDGLIFDGTSEQQNSETKGSVTEHDVSRLVFLHASKNPDVMPVDIAEHRVNYFTGRDESKWKTAIPTSKAVLYKNLYKNINLKIYGVEGQIEYDYIVKPGGKVADIKFEYADIKSTRVDKNGNLIIQTELGELRHAKPSCYQTIEGKKFDVKCQFRKKGQNAYGFEVEKFNPNYELAIDPTVIYSTYLGGADWRENAYSIAVDSKGYAYVAGWTASANFPLKKPFQNKIKGQTDVFICKIKPLGKQLVYSSFLGGSDFDYAYSVAVDKNGAAYITGTTYSLNDFPLKNPFQSIFGGSWADAFVCKINPSGSALVFSTFLGGDGHDYGWGIAVDSSFNVYVTGETSSANFPTQNPIQAVHGGYRDAFVTKINSEGNAFVYSTYLGGSENDNGYAIVLDSSQAVYIAGNTWSSNFPVKNALYGTYRGDGDAIIAKINPAGNDLVYSTYFGGTGEEEGLGIAVDNTSSVYITGWTSSKDLPLKSAFQKTYGGGLEDGFVTKINANGTGLVFSTYLGGLDMDKGLSIAVNANSNAYVTGHTFSKNFPIKNSLKPHTAYFEADVFIIQFERNGKKVVYSTLFGGRSDDWGIDICLDSLDQVYVSGITYAWDFPVKNAILAKSSKNCDGFVVKLK